MKLAKITGQGLKTIALLVVVLWTCLLAERVTIRHAQREYSEAMNDMRALRRVRRVEPVSKPAAPPVPFNSRPVVS